MLLCSSIYITDTIKLIKYQADDMFTLQKTSNQLEGIIMNKYTNPFDAIEEMMRLIESGVPESESIKVLEGLPALKLTEKGERAIKDNLATKH